MSDEKHEAEEGVVLPAREVMSILPVEPEAEASVSGEESVTEADRAERIESSDSATATN